MTTEGLVEAFASKVLARGVPIRRCSDSSRLTVLEEKLAKRLPQSFEVLLSNYEFPLFDVVGISLFGWDSDSNAYIEEATAKKGSLSEVLLPKGYVQIGRPDTGSFDAVCFDLNQKSQNREYRIVEIDHEEILCNWRVRVSRELWSSFVKLMETAISISDPQITSEY